MSSPEVLPVTVTCAPCCWGVDDVKNPHLPPWERVLDEAAAAGFGGLELGPYGYMPLDVGRVGAALDARGLRIVAGTIFDDLVNPGNRENLLRQTDEICTFITALPRPRSHEGQRYPAPYLTVMDWGHDERDYAAGHSDRAPRLDRRRLGRHGREHPRHRRTRSRPPRRPRRHPPACRRLHRVRGRARPDRGRRAGRSCRALPRYRPPRLFRDGPGRDDQALTPTASTTSTSRTSTRPSTPTSWAAASASSRPAPRASCARSAAAASTTDRSGRCSDEIGYAGYITIEQERDPRNAGSVLADLTASRDFLRRSGF